MVDLESITEMNSIWRMAPSNWRCPGCRRDKMAVVRTEKSGKIVAKLVEHYCQGIGIIYDTLQECGGMKSLPRSTRGFVFDTVYPLVRRFKDCIICGYCNDAEEAARKVAGCDKRFSFSPVEIARFIIVSDDTTNDINHECAINTWKKAKDQYFSMGKIAGDLIRACSEGSIWTDATRYESLSDFYKLYGNR